MKTSDLTSPHLIFLPGLDGTGDLFSPLLELIPPRFQKRIVAYPVDQPLSYDDLLELVKNQLLDEGEVVLIAESFSGPLALRWAIMHPHRVRAVVLCASFIHPPIPRWLCRFARAFFFRLPLPKIVLRQLLVGLTAPAELVRWVKKTIRKVRPEVLAARVRAIGDLNCADALRECPLPVLYLAAAQDAIVGKSSLAAIMKVRGDVRVRTIAGPHMLLQVEPLAAWREIEMFIGELNSKRL